MSRELPAKANLEHLKERAKDLPRKLQQGDAAAVEPVRSHVSFSAPASLKLADLGLPVTHSVRPISEFVDLNIHFSSREVS